MRSENLHDSLLIVGAGPKAMAIAAKATVLAKLGIAVPEIHIVEKCSVGAHWNGLAGYTNGKMELGTSPEKDVGFPYQTRVFDERENPGLNHSVNALMQSFSWNAFQIERGTYSSWVDRGRPCPTHSVWANYLLWVSERLSPSVHIHYGQVNRLAMTDGGWETEFQTDSGARTLETTGIVMTGPGKIKKAEALARCERVLDIESFWKRLPEVAATSSRIGIVGAGENAASIALALSRGSAFRGDIEIISPSGFLFSRGESYRENRVYSDPEVAGWKSLSLRARREFIRRTDLGVFSQYAQKYLDGVDGIHVIPGRLLQVLPGVVAEVQTHRSVTRHSYDFLVMATGFDQAATLSSLLDAESCRKLTQKLGIPALTQPELESRIAEDLSLEGLKSKLHLPSLAGLMQGPGFSNLSSLGRLADRVLSTYILEEEMHEEHTSADSDLCVSGK